MTANEVLTLLEAARWAPSASNMQPWRFVYALRGEAGFDAIADALVPFNRGWAEKASALIVVASKTTTLKDGAEVPNMFHAFDTGAAWAQLALQAHLKGWIAHAMGGFDHSRLAVNLKLPEGYALHAVVAVGHQGDPVSLNEMLQAREHPNDRLPLADVARHGSFA
jgi:nitroreductase